MPSIAKLGWYAKRLSRMSAAEIGHRVGEQLRRRADARHAYGWDDFGGFGGSLGGFPGLSVLGLSSLDATARAETEAVVAGRLGFLGQVWPDLPERWWEGDAWLLDPVTGRRWAGSESFAFNVDYRHASGMGDVKFVWEVNRLQFLQSLALHAALSRDGETWNTIWRLLRGWMAVNPPFRGINWTNGIEAASRLLSLFVVLALAPPEQRPQDDRFLRAFIEAHAYWIARYPSRFSSANNHLVAEAAALFIAYSLAPGMAGAPIVGDHARAILESEVHRQFHADGVGAEQSPTYAAYSLEWFLLAGLVADHESRPLSTAFKSKVQAAAEGLIWFFDEAGRPPRIGDDDEGRVIATSMASEPRYVSSVAAAAFRWSRGADLPANLRDPSIRDALAPVGHVPTIALPRGARTFEQGGYSVWRSEAAEGQVVLAFDHGPLGFLSIAAHGHADALSVWLSCGDEPVIVDAGTYLYHAGGDWRDRFRGTAAHNTLALEGEDQSRISGAFNWTAHAKCTVLSCNNEEVLAEHDGYLKRYGVRSCRKVMLVNGPGHFRIEDCLAGTHQTPLRWCSGFTLAPGARAQIEGRTAHVETLGGRTFSLSIEDSAPGLAWAILQVPYSARFNQRIETARLELEGGHVSGASPCIACIDVRLLGRT